MGTPNDVLRIAAGEIGYYAPDDPQPGSKYGRWMADVTGESWLAGPSTEVWWCMIFVSWVFAQAGVDFPGSPSYNTDSTLAAARKVGRVTDAGHAGRATSWCSTGTFPARQQTTWESWRRTMARTCRPSRATLRVPQQASSPTATACGGARATTRWWRAWCPHIGTPLRKAGRSRERSTWTDGGGLPR